MVTRQRRSPRPSLPDRAVADAPECPDGLVGRGIARLCSDDLAGALQDLSLAQATYRRHHMPLHWGIIGLAFLAETEYRLGAWDDATIHAELAVAIARDTHQEGLAPLVHAVAAFPLAARGSASAPWPMPRPPRRTCGSWAPRAAPRGLPPLERSSPSPTTTSRGWRPRWIRFGACLTGRP